MNYTLLLLLAVFPALVLITYIYYKDSHDKEPVGLLIQLFLLGVGSIIPAIIIEAIGEAIINIFFYDGTLIYNFVYSFFVIALAEEGFKFLFTYVRTWNCRDFNHKFDGIVYAMLVSLGFATLENILYVFQGGLSTAIMRALLSVPSHAIDAVFMGYYYGLAKYDESSGKTASKNTHLALSLIIPVLLHGFYDFCLFHSTLLTTALFFIFVVIMDIAAIVRINISSKQDQIIYQRMYQAYPQYFSQMPQYGGYNNQYTYNNVNPYGGQYPYNNPFPQPMQTPPQQSGFGPHWRTQAPVYYFPCIKCGNICNSFIFYCPRCGNPLRRF